MIKYAYSSPSPFIGRSTVVLSICVALYLSKLSSIMRNQTVTAIFYCLLERLWKPLPWVVLLPCSLESTLMGDEQYVNYVKGFEELCFLWKISKAEKLTRTIKNYTKLIYLNNFSINSVFQINLLTKIINLNFKNLMQ